MKSVNSEVKLYTGCWTCMYIGNIGKDSRGDIAYCEYKHCVVDPNIGCIHKKKVIVEYKEAN